MTALSQNANFVRGMRVGLLGGSFNPAHRAHMQISLAALRRLDLQRVVWLVSPQNPLKSTGETAPYEARLNAAKLIANHPNITVSDLENRLGSRYTVDTLSRLRSRFPDVFFVWLMGSDNLIQLPQWKDWTRIMTLVPVAVFARPPDHVRAPLGQAAQRFRSARIDATDGHALATLTPPRWIYIEDFLNPLSSTQIRRRSAAAPR